MRIPSYEFRSSLACFLKAGTRVARNRRFSFSSILIEDPNNRNKRKNSYRHYNRNPNYIRNTIGRSLSLELIIIQL